MAGRAGAFEAISRLAGRGAQESGDDLAEALVRTHESALGTLAADRLARHDQGLLDFAKQMQESIVAPERAAMTKRSRLDDMLERFDADPAARRANDAIVQGVSKNLGNLTQEELGRAKKIAARRPLQRALALLKSHDMTIEDAPLQAASPDARRAAPTTDLYASGRQVEGQISNKIRAALLGNDVNRMLNLRKELLEPDQHGRSLAASFASSGATETPWREALALTTEESSIVGHTYTSQADEAGKAAAQVTAGGAAAVAAPLALAENTIRIQRGKQEEPEEPVVADEPMLDQLAPLRVEIGAPATEALQKLAQLAHNARNDDRLQTELDGALASIGEVGPRRAAATLIRVSKAGGELRVDDDLVTAADRLVEHFARRPVAPPATGGEDDAGAILERPVAAPREDAPSDAGPASGAEQGDVDTSPGGAPAPPLLDQERVSVRQFQRRFNQVKGRLGAEGIAADNVRGPVTDAAVKAVFSAMREDVPPDPEDALQRAHEAVQGWFVGDASVKRIQDLLIAVLGPEALPRFGADGVLGEETIAAIQALGVPGIDPTDGLTVEERNVIYYEYGLGNPRWRDQKASGRG